MLPADFRFYCILQVCESGKTAVESAATVPGQPKAFMFRDNFLNELLHFFK